MEQQARRDPYGITGTTLGSYQIHELVGIGGMGVVYRAQHLTTEGIVAVKVLKPDLALSNPAMDKLFFEEAKKTVGLNHPYIIRVTHAERTSNGIAFLVMEWLDGHTLEDELKEGGMMPLERVITLLEQICEAVAYAHSKGTIHRDLKPGNIMIVTDHKGDEAVKILDFGIAKALTSTMGTTSRAMGAPFYASPEQLVANVSIDHRSDIYTLGVLLHHLLTGDVPFNADSLEGLIYKHISVAPPSVRQSQPDIPEAVEEVILRALAKRPEDRYHSATELARAFRQATGLKTGALRLQCLDSSTGSSLAGASIYINGKFYGRTDEEGWWSKKDFSPGDHLLEVDCSRYARWVERVRTNPREEVTITARIIPKELGDLIVKTTTAGAEVLLDGRKVGTTDQAGMLYVPDLALGKFLVEIKRPKHRTVASEVEIIQGRPWYWEVELMPLPRRRLAKEVVQKIISTVSVVAKAFRRQGQSIPRRQFSTMWKIGVAAACLAFMVLVGVTFMFFVSGRGESIVEERIPPPQLATPTVVPTVAPVAPDPTPTAMTSPDGMVYVAGGTFEMGRNDGDEYERPAHSVTVSSFYIDKYEVTREQYAKFIEATNRLPPSTWVNGRYPPDEAQLPVVGVNWIEANAYAQWAGKRLPTEAEWEFAARGTDGRLYPWGDEWRPDIVNAGKTVRKFVEVGSHPENASPSGAYDMAGNAWEWTASTLAAYPGGAISQQNAGDYKIIRGGSSPKNPQEATVTFRGYVLPRGENVDDYNSTGFRCVISVSDASPPP